MKSNNLINAIMINITRFKIIFFKKIYGLLILKFYLKSNNKISYKHF